ncbi:MAG: domain containing protein [Tardiphaga sp.]|nr:domain containing protein [Tardiphaga sp.]
MSNYETRNGSDQARPDQATWRSGQPAGDDAYAYGADMNPELYSGVLTKRLVAFLIDVVIISIPVVLATIFIALFGVVTLGLGWGLFWLLSPASIVWPVVYYGCSLGGPHSATVGMRMLGLQMRTGTGERGYFVLGAAHALLFWASVSLLTPFVLLVGLFNSRRRLLHDLVLGTVVVNTAAQAFAAQPGRAY